MNPHTLKTLIEQAEAARDAAACALAEQTTRQGQARQQLAALVDYRQEYARRLSDAMRDGASMHRIDNDQRFLAALDGAVAQQTRVVEDAERRVAGCTDQWQHTAQRKSAFDALQTRYARQAREQAQRREQQTTDESASRLVHYGIHR